MGTAVLDNLKEIGLTEKEASIYLTLIKKGSLSGYKLSKETGIPSSNIYAMLESLKTKGFVMYTHTNNASKFSAVPMKEVANYTVKKTERALERLNDSLSIYPQMLDMDNVWHIKEFDNTFLKCEEIIKNTQKELLIQIWLEDIKELLPSLKELEARGVPVVAIVFVEGEENEVKIPLKSLYLHPLSNLKKIEMGGRFISLVSDMDQVIFGQILNTSSVEVIWSKSMPIVELASEYIRHDAYCYRYAEKIEELSPELRVKDMEWVRNIYR